MRGGALYHSAAGQLWWDERIDDVDEGYLTALAATNATTCWRAMLAACSERNI